MTEESTPETSIIDTLPVKTYSPEENNGHMWTIPGENTYIRQLDPEDKIDFQRLWDVERTQLKDFIGVAKTPEELKEQLEEDKNTEEESVMGNEQALLDYIHRFALTHSSAETDLKGGR